MKVILRQTFEGLGSIGEQVEVKSGYARNFLIPRNIVMAITKGNLKVLNEEKREKRIVRIKRGKQLNKWLKRWRKYP